MTQHILNQTCLYLRGRAEFAEAKVLYDRALSLAEKAYGPDLPEVASASTAKVRNNLEGIMNYELGVICNGIAFVFG